MPNINQMKKTMVKQKLPMEIISKFNIFGSNGNKPEDVIKFINQMDQLLSKEECLLIMEQQGCNKTENVIATFRQFGIANTGKTIKKKIKLLEELETIHKAPCTLNSDGTLSIYLDCGLKENYRCFCVCRTIKKLSDAVNISLTYCGCCGGHIRNNYQYALGVKLHLKDIISPSISSKKQYNIEFKFEIIEEQ